MAETVNEFITRLRLEKALMLMRCTPRLSLTGVALESGFQTSANFSRVFKRRLGVSPRRFDLAAYWKDRKIGKEDDYQIPYHLKELPRELTKEFSVSLNRRPEFTVAYIRVFDSLCGRTGTGGVPQVGAMGETAEAADAGGKVDRRFQRRSGHRAIEKVQLRCMPDGPARRQRRRRSGRTAHSGFSLCDFALPRGYRESGPGMAVPVPDLAAWFRISAGEPARHGNILPDTLMREVGKNSIWKDGFR
jgi:AraC-like DNA-binding protein